MDRHANSRHVAIALDASNGLGTAPRPSSWKITATLSGSRTHLRGHCRRGVLAHHGQGARRPRAPGVQPCRCDAGAVVPERSLGDRAAFYATAALLIGRWRGRPTRALLAGLAAGIAVAVAATRVLLDVHWLSDVVAGLALGWAWFAICAIAFGGRILRFGAAAETAARAADATEAAEAPSGTAATRSAVSARSPSPSR